MAISDEALKILFQDQLELTKQLNDRMILLHTQLNIQQYYSETLENRIKELEQEKTK